MTSDGAFINDTSDQMSECDKQEASALLDGGKDPYLKIKINANLALRNLFKNYGKILQNFWYIVFPSFMIRPQSEFTQYLYEFDNKKTHS